MFKILDLYISQNHHRNYVTASSDVVGSLRNYQVRRAAERLVVVLMIYYKRCIFVLLSVPRDIEMFFPMADTGAITIRPLLLLLKVLMAENEIAGSQVR